MAKTTIDIEYLHVKDGETVTVYLDGVQVELRVDKGKREIFTDCMAGQVIIKKWSEWKAKDGE